LSATRRKALILSYSPIARDPRVRRQIQWLASAGIEVEVWGLGPAPCVGESAYNQISFPPTLVRLVCYLLLGSKQRSSILVGKQLANLSSSRSGESRLDLVVLNDLDFLGIDDLFIAWEALSTKVVLDLHEYFFDVGGPVVWRLFHVRYYRWLLKKLRTRSLSRIFTVSDELARLYESKFYRPVLSIENTPDSLRVNELISKSPQLGDDQKIQLVHHGIFGKSRGILRMIRAMRSVDSRFELNLMLLMSSRAKSLIIFLALLLGVRDRIKIHEPVPVGSILNKISEFDVEVIFFHPPNSTSVHYSLPNKFFEGLAAGLAFVVGANPSMSTIVNRFKVGVVTKAWTARSLADAINELTRESINEFKSNTHLALEAFSDARLSGKLTDLLEENNPPKTA
jgi:glycosyltransferase involved in cell wall biosynthesis